MRTHIRCIVKRDLSIQQERMLFCTEWATGAVVRVILRDVWAATHVHCGNIVNVDGPFADGPLPPRIVVSAAAGMLVVNPDVRVAVSDVVHACSRAAWHSDAIADVEHEVFAPVHASTGIIVQELLLKALAAPAAGPAFTPDHVRTTLAENSACVAQNGHTDEEVRLQLDLFPHACANFLRIFEGRAGASPCHRGGLRCVDVNEEVSSHRYGLVGFPDATVGLPANGAEGSGTDMRIGPLDIKAGRPRPEHETQVTLYALMLSDKYGGEPSKSLIYYAQVGRLVHVDFTRRVVVEAVATRNLLAALHVLQRRGLEHWTGALPSTYLSGEIQAALDLKLLVGLNYRAAAMDHSHEARSLRNARIETAGLGDYECKYFADQSRAIALEEGAAERAMVELWTTPALAREAGGKALADLALVGGASLSPAGTRARATRYSFARRAGTGSFLEGPLAEGDAVVVSVEPDLPVVARGIVREVLPERLTVSAFKPLDVNGVLLASRRIRGGPLVFALDRDESAAGPERTIRHNLARLFRKGQKRLRRLIVPLQAPEFAPVMPSSPSQALNAEQQAAVKRVLSANDYALIRALPGTGVLRTVTHCIRRLVDEGKSILLSSHSNAVLDATICALGGAPFGVLRLGKANKMHPDAKQFTLAGGEQEPPRSADEYCQRIHEPAVVAITCLSVKDTVFCGRIFDVCIVLDASRVTMPTCLGPLFHAKAFVLVGDERQLGPIIRTPSARREGLAETLFERLCKAHPSAVSDLTRQYRMSSAVMTPSNELSYDGRLVCATAQVAQKVLRLAFKTHCSVKECLLDWVLDQSCTFVDTDGLFSNGSANDPIGAQLIDKMCGALIAAGIDQHRIGVLAFYRPQVRALKRVLQSYPRINVCTIDSANSVVKDCVLVYMAKTKPADQEDSGLLADPQRMATALTQSRCKLVIVGGRRDIGIIPSIRRLLNRFDSHGWSVAPTWDEVDHGHSQPCSRSTQGIASSSPSSTLRGYKRHRSLEVECAGTARPQKRVAIEVDNDAAVATSFII